MCGIAGILDKRKRPDILKNKICQKMLDMIFYRGPDENKIINHSSSAGDGIIATTSYNTLANKGMIYNNSISISFLRVSLISPMLSFEIPIAIVPWLIIWKPNTCNVPVAAIWTNERFPIFLKVGI